MTSSRLARVGLFWYFFDLMFFDFFGRLPVATFQGLGQAAVSSWLPTLSMALEKQLGPPMTRCACLPMEQVCTQIGEPGARLPGFQGGPGTVLGT